MPVQIAHWVQLIEVVVVVAVAVAVAVLCSISGLYLTASVQLATLMPLYKPKDKPTEAPNIAPMLVICVGIEGTSLLMVWEIGWSVIEDPLSLLT